MLALFILLYLGLNLAIGFWASRKITSSYDFVLAGQNLPFSLAACATFATWFGSESIMGAPAEFLKHGVLGIIEEPFGAALCLLLIGIFYARRFYQMRIITFCDFFRVRYGKRAELLSAILIIPSYFSWIAAQLMAMGIVLQIILVWELLYCIFLSAAIVIIYTNLGGMWSISVTDFVQTILIIVGLTFVAVVLYQKLPDGNVLLTSTSDNFYNFLPKATPHAMLTYLAAWITIGLGSIPQQDVFQRVVSAKSADIAVKASLMAAFLYITVALLPLFIALCGSILYPELARQDLQMLLPNLILMHSSLPMQILFFGALVSAILSTTSSAIIAPATIMGENVFKYFNPALTDQQLLRIIRLSVVVITLICIVLANSGDSIFELVAESSAFSLVSLFIPLTAGMFTKWANSIGCIVSMVVGLLAWLICLQIDTHYPPVLYGLAMSAAGILLSKYCYPSRVS